MLEREFALDVSRLIWRSWSRRVATGIDRVSYAYLENFKDRAQCVVQYRGHARILSVSHSEQLFALLIERDETFRGKLLALAPKALAQAQSIMDCRGAFYLNVGHTDMDIARHMRWVDACRLHSLYMIHDLIPLTHSEYCNPAAVGRHRGRVRNALAHAAGIITNSKASADALRQFAIAERLRQPPVVTAWLAGTRFERAGAPSIEARPHFVCVGTIEARKNHYLLLHVWRRLVERMGEAAPRLVIIGQKGAQAGHVETMLDRCTALHNHVTTLPNCSDKELGHWIGTARALLIPSFAEGFGLPLVEALQMGTPVIASDLPCFREIGREIPTFIDPLDAIIWERTIVAYLEDHPDRRRQISLMHAYRPPSWKDHFNRVEAWLKGLPSRPSDDRTCVRAVTGAGMSDARLFADRRSLAVDGRIR